MMALIFLHFESSNRRSYFRWPLCKGPAVKLLRDGCLIAKLMWGSGSSQEEVQVRKIPWFFDGFFRRFSCWENSIRDGSFGSWNWISRWMRRLRKVGATWVWQHVKPCKHFVQILQLIFQCQICSSKIFCSFVGRRKLVSAVVRWTQWVVLEWRWGIDSQQPAGCRCKWGFFGVDFHAEVDPSTKSVSQIAGFEGKWQSAG